MADMLLNQDQDYAGLFQRSILLNVRYWQDYTALKKLDVSRLDRESDGIVRAILFGLDYDEAWASVRELIIAFAPYMERRGYWDVWNKILDRAIHVARQRTDMAGELTLSALFARLLQRQSRVRKTITYFCRTIYLARQLGDHYEEARAYTNLGYLYIEQDHWYRAEVLCCRALKIFTQIDNNHGRAHTENHLGILYTRQWRWQLAEQHLKRACAVWQAMKDHHGLMRGFINLGFLYNEMLSSDKALYYLDKAQQEAKLTGEVAELGTIYLNMAHAYRLAGDPAQAERYARQAEDIFKQYSNSSYLTLTWINLGIIYLDQEKFDKAKSYLDTALQIACEAKNTYAEVKALMCLIEYDLALDNFQSASIRLAALENRVTREALGEKYRRLQRMFYKYRRSLPERLLQPATTY